MSKIDADEAKIKEAIVVITEALADNDIPTIEGAIAMKYLLNQIMEKEGIVINTKGQLN